MGQQRANAYWIVWLNSEILTNVENLLSQEYTSIKGNYELLTDGLSPCVTGYKLWVGFTKDIHDNHHNNDVELSKLRRYENLKWKLNKLHTVH